MMATLVHNPRSFCVYLDTIRDDTEKSSLVSGADLIEAEDDEKHQVRSAVIPAIAAVRGKDGMTHPIFLKCLSIVLDADDVSTIGTLVSAFKS